SPSCNRVPKNFGNQKKSAADMAKVAATPMTRWKWPMTNSSLTAARARSCRARNIPESPPAMNSEINPIVNSMDVLSCTCPLHNVPSQLASRNAAGIPREDASTTRRSFHTGLRENVAIRCVTMPKHGSTATYTSACAKYQKSRCQRMGRLPCRTRFCGCAARKDAVLKKFEPSKRSERTAAHPASRTLKISMLRMALMNQAHTVTGMRGRVIPFARISIVVVVKFKELNNAAREKTAALASHRLIPLFNGKKKEVAIPNREPTVIQNESKFSEGKAISSAPICNGRRKFPKPSCGAAVSTKKTISEPWSKRIAANRSGVVSIEARNGMARSGHVACSRNNAESTIPTRTLASASHRYCRPMVLWRVENTRERKLAPRDGEALSPSSWVTIFKAETIAGSLEPDSYLNASPENCKKGGLPKQGSFRQGRLSCASCCLTVADIREHQFDEWLFHWKP